MSEDIRVVSIFLGHERQPGACEIYRGTMPLWYLGQQDGWQTRWIWFSSLWEMYQKQGAKTWLDLIENNDIFVFPRVFTADELSQQAIGGLFQVIRSAGKRIVYETDDDYTNQHRNVIPGDAMAVASWADAVTVTTPYLGKLMQKHTKRPYYVLPNCISPANFTGNMPVRKPQFENKLIVALTGSSTHVEDWKVLTSVMPQFLAEHPHVEFVMMGYYPEYLDGLPQTSLLPPAPYDQYAAFLRVFDIIMAPVLPSDRFNMGKSPIKAIEGQAAERDIGGGEMGGAAVIATKNPIYELAIKDGKTGLLVDHTPEAWLNGLRKLVRDVELRKSLQRKGYRWVYKNHDITKTYRLWGKAYKKILAAPPNNKGMQLTKETIEKGQ